MKKTTVGVIIVVLAVIGGGGFLVLSGRPDTADQPTPESTSDTQQQGTGDQAPENSTDNADTQAPATTTNKVEIKDFSFQPVSITVKKGTAVTWTNKDSVNHSVEPDTESDAFRGSELLSRDASYSFTFNTPGTYTYHCGPHPNMTASVLVTE